MWKIGCNSSSYKSTNIKYVVLLVIGIPALIFSLYLHGQKISYFLRPLWQSPPKAFNDIPHYYHENVSMKELCQLHGWRVRNTPRRVFDAVLFSNEIDILAIRWNELYPYVSEFIILESNSTFTGVKKPLFFAENRHLFKSFDSRLTYGTVGGRFVRGENPFVEEAYQRIALDQLIRIAGIRDDDLLIMSDVDEIPSGHTINLLRWCDDIPEILHLRLRNYLYSFEFFIDNNSWRASDLLIMSDVDEIPSGHTINLLRWCDDIPEILHLRLRNYLYSFEFFIDNNSWRASVHRYRPGKTRYGHFRRTDSILSDSGWHCSFCFRYIPDFIFKMKAYSHVDRVRFNYFLNPSRIQDVICRGKDLFDMLPEEYTFRDLIGKMGPIPHSYSAVNLPKYLIQNADTYQFLLPGNCKRETAYSYQSS